MEIIEKRSTRITLISYFLYFSFSKGSIYRMKYSPNFITRRAVKKRESVNDDFISDLELSLVEK